MTWDDNLHISNGVLGGKILESLIIAPKENPYIVLSDITVMPGVTLTILPGTILEFAPNIGILVLGSLVARGYTSGEIIFKPINKAMLSHPHNLKSRYNHNNFNNKHFIFI